MIPNQRDVVPGLRELERLGIQLEVWAVIMLVAGAVIASAVGLTRGDAAYMLVIVWAFVGIAVKHATTPLVATAAWVTTAVVVLMLVASVFLKRRTG